VFSKSSIPPAPLKKGGERVLKSPFLRETGEFKVPLVKGVGAFKVPLLKGDLGGSRIPALLKGDLGGSRFGCNPNLDLVLA
jgi:hypothetical protein